MIRSSHDRRNAARPSVPTLQKRRFVRLVLAWYKRCGRDLPWRRTRDPYRILVSEIMLQQTPVVRVLPKYHEWLERYPTPAALAGARRRDVERAWRPLGYNDRARRLHAIARGVVRDGGGVPDTLEGLLALDGVGEYTARAVMLFAYDQRTAVLDTNIARVLSRVFGIGSAAGGAPKGRDARALWALAGEVLPRSRAYDFTQALMDIGATICLKRHARCELCPARAACSAHARRLDPTLRAHRALDASVAPAAGSSGAVRRTIPRGGFRRVPGDPPRANGARRSPRR